MSTRTGFATSAARRSKEPLWCRILSHLPSTIWFLFLSAELTRERTWRLLTSYATRVAGLDCFPKAEIKQPDGLILTFSKVRWQQEELSRVTIVIATIMRATDSRVAIFDAYDLDPNTNDMGEGWMLAFRFSF